MFDFGLAIIKQCKKEANMIILGYISLHNKT